MGKPEQIFQDEPEDKEEKQATRETSRHNLARPKGYATDPGASGRLFSSKHRIYAVCQRFYRP
jgi:hypothetical protein